MELVSSALSILTLVILDLIQKFSKVRVTSVPLRSNLVYLVNSRGLLHCNQIRGNIIFVSMMVEE